MELIRQPKNSYLCGQSSIATIAGITLEESIKVYGHNKSTNMPQHKKALESLGFSTGKLIKADNRKSYNLPHLSIVRLEKIGRNMGHLVVHCDGKFYDPAEGVFNSKDELLSYYSKFRGKWRIRHYMEVTKSNNTMVAGN